MPQEMEPVRALAFETGILEQINKLGINLNERVVDDTYNTNDMGFEFFLTDKDFAVWFTWPYAKIQLCTVQDI
ncbi:2738_t:CDS:2 [Entrophospora sp. SA101]|nr:2738_t:CDS:2 [Entrophospora sp. SA101]